MDGLIGPTSRIASDSKIKTQNLLIGKRLRVRFQKVPDCTPTNARLRPEQALVAVQVTPVWKSSKHG